MEATMEHDVSRRRALVLAATAVAVFVADQVTKALVVANIGYGERVEVLGDFVLLWHVRNTGAAFSLFPGATWLFIPVHLLAIVLVGWFFLQFRNRGPWIHVVLGGILAASIAHLVDRVRQGYVVDFVSVGLGDVRWPTFNVADSTLVVGIGILVLYLTFVDGRERSRAST